MSLRVSFVILMIAFLAIVASLFVPFAGEVWWKALVATLCGLTTVSFFLQRTCFGAIIGAMWLFNTIVWISMIF